MNEAVAVVAVQSTRREGGYLNGKLRFAEGLARKRMSLEGF